MFDINNHGSCKVFEKLIYFDLFVHVFGQIPMCCFILRCAHIFSMCLASVDMIVWPPGQSPPRHKKSTEGPRLSH